MKRNTAGALLGALAFFAVAARLGLASEPSAPPSFDGLEAYIEQARKDWNVPGLAVAIVKDDKIVFAKGFGTRTIDKEEPVDADTLFAVGSTSKAFTAAATAMLVEEGKLGWDDHVIDRLPEFQLHDPYVTREMTIRDLLCHRSGLDRGDLIWYASAFDRREVLRRARYLQPISSFRSQFGYQNIMYLAAGLVVESAGGKTWDEFIKARIFDPLGMKRSNTSVKALAGTENVATPHVEVDGKLVAVPYRNIDNIAPAGSINSSANEMAQWARLQLGRGEIEGRRLLSERSIETMWTPLIPVPSEGPWAKNSEINFTFYALGWGVLDYRGKRLLQHGGGIDGMTTSVALMPDQRIGYVAIANKSGTPLPGALMYRAFDHCLGAPERDWSKETLEKVKPMMALQKMEEKSAEAKRVKDTHPSLALEKYAGEYESKIYGKLAVKLEAGALVLERPGSDYIADLEHWHYDSFMAKPRSAALGKGVVTFALGADGSVASISTEGMGKLDRVPAEKPAQK